MANLKGVKESLADKVLFAIDQSKRRASKPFWITTGKRDSAEQIRLFTTNYTTVVLSGRPCAFWKGKWWYLKLGRALVAVPNTSDHEKDPAKAVDVACLARDNAVRIEIFQEADLSTIVAGEPWHVTERTSKPLTKAMVAIIEEDVEMSHSLYITVPCPSGGYWLLKRSDGGVGALAGAPFLGAMPAADPGRAAKVVAPLVGLTPAVREGVVIGYWIYDEAGHVYAYGKAPHYKGYAEHPQWQSPNRKITGLVQTAGWNKGQTIRYSIIGEEVGDGDYVVDTYDLGPEFNK